jgi:uncharacterized protein
MLTYILFLGLGVGLVIALSGAPVVTPPPVIRDLAVGAVGAAAGASVNGDVAATFVHRPLAVGLGVAATLVVSLGFGQLLRLGRDVSGVTASFSSVPGMAVGVSLMAREYGADAPTVLTVQYLRVIAVALSVPVVAPLLGAGIGGRHAASDASSATAYALAAVTVGVGVILARLAPVAAGPLMFPLLLSAALGLSGWFRDTSVPEPVLALAYGMVGFSVGVELTRTRIRSLASLMPLALAQTTLSIAACAATGLVLARATGISRLDAYLATTPGGLPAVAAVTSQIGDQVGLVLAMQTLRLLLALAVTSLIGAHYARRSSRDDTVGPRPAFSARAGRPCGCEGV